MYMCCFQLLDTDVGNGARQRAVSVTQKPSVYRRQVCCRRHHRLCRSPSAMTSASCRFSL